MADGIVEQSTGHHNTAYAPTQHSTPLHSTPAETLGSVYDDVCKLLGRTGVVSPTTNEW